VFVVESDTELHELIVSLRVYFLF